MRPTLSTSLSSMLSAPSTIANSSGHHLAGRALTPWTAVSPRVRSVGLDPEDVERGGAPHRLVEVGVVAGVLDHLEVLEVRELVLVGDDRKERPFRQGRKASRARASGPSSVKLMKNWRLPASRVTVPMPGSFR